jgi:ParB-like chromosome segregation protein Spo0J
MTSDTAPNASLAVHPVAQIFPKMSLPDLEALARDIDEHGQHEPIWLHPDGSIIDGRNRYLACQIAGREPKTASWVESEHGELIPFVLSQNLRRRQLTTPQRALVAAQLADFRPGDRDAQICASITQDEAAKLTKVSRRSVQSARKVLDGGVPELVELVASGDLAVSAALFVADLTEDRQREIVHKGVREIRAAAKAARAVSLVQTPGKPAVAKEPGGQHLSFGVSDAQEVESSAPDRQDTEAISDRIRTAPTAEPTGTASEIDCPVFVAEPLWAAHRGASSGGMDDLAVKGMVEGFILRSGLEDCALLLRVTPYWLADGLRVVAQLAFDRLLVIPASCGIAAAGQDDPARGYVLLGLRGDSATVDANGLMRWLDRRRGVAPQDGFDIRGLAGHLSRGTILAVADSDATRGGDHGA